MGVLPGQDHPHDRAEHGGGADADRGRSRTTDADAKARLLKTIDTWKKTAARYNDEPETHEGRKQLAERAKEAEHQRDEALARYHNYEFASAAFQIGIVLASATIITGMTVLAWLSGALGLAGLALSAFGLWAPHALDFLTRQRRALGAYAARLR